MAALSHESAAGLEQPGGAGATRSGLRHLAPAELLALPAFVSLPTAAEVIGLGRSTAYELARRNEFPCRLVRIGRSYRVPSEELRRLAGVEQPPQNPVGSSCRAGFRPRRPTTWGGTAGRCPNCCARLHRRRGAEHVHP